MFRGLLKWQGHTSQAIDSRTQIPNHLHVADREDDGFILVGQTAIERTAVHASVVDGYNWENQPPSYFEVVQGSNAWTMGNSASQAPTTPESAAVVRDTSLGSLSSPLAENPQRISAEVQQNPESNNLSYQDSYRHYVRATSPPDTKHLVASTYTPSRSRPVSAMSNPTNTLDFSTCADAHIVKAVPFRLSAALNVDRTTYDAYVGLVKPIDMKRYNYDFSLEREIRDGD